MNSGVGSGRVPVGRVLASLWIALAVGLAVRPAAAGPGTGLEEGGAAPDGWWTIDGGCPARTNRTLTRPVRGGALRAWKHEFDGAIEGDPLVYPGRVLVASRAGSGKRVLTLLDLEDGTVLDEETFRTNSSLSPTIGPGVAVVRYDDKALAALRLEGDNLRHFWTARLTEPVSSPVLVGRELYAIVGGSLVRLQVGRNAPIWEVAGGYSGDLSVRGRYVYAVARSSNELHLRCVERTTGASVSSTLIGYPRSDRAGREGSRVAVMEGTILVHPDVLIPTTGGLAANLCELRRSGPAVKFQGLWRGYGETVPFAGGWLGLIQSEKKGRVLALSTPDGTYRELATATEHGEFVEGDLAPSRAGGIAYLRGRAVDLESREVLWSTGADPSGRMVPARRHLLVVEGGRRLTAWARPRFVPTARWFDASVEGEDGVKGEVVLRNGVVRTGSFRLDAEAGVLTAGRTSIEKSDLLVLEDESGVVRGAVESEDAVRGLEILADRDLGEAFAELAVEAGKARDPDRLSRYLGEALALGAEGRSVRSAESKLKQLERRKKPPEPDARRVAKLDARLRELGHRRAAFFAMRLGKLPESVPGAVRVALLRAILAEDPKQPDAVKMVRSLLPEGLDIPGEFDAGEWLDFLEVIAIRPVKILRPPEPGETGISPAMRLYGGLLYTWRKDLVALKSERLLVVTTVDLPGRIARCLALGELVCEMLDETFSGGREPPKDDWPMVLLLYGTEEEFRKVARGTAASESSARTAEWAGGHYDGNAGCSRLFLPADDDGFGRVAQVFAHELTHQWVGERGPLFGVPGNTPGKAEGYWVEEGFANCVEELDFDTETRTWTRDPLPESLDIVARTPSKLLLPWKEVFSIDYEAFSKLDLKDTVPVPYSRRLGYTRGMSRVGLFYAQAGAVTEWLFHARDGANREKLFEFMRAYHSREPANLPKLLGLSAEEIGRRVVEYARSLGEAR